MSKEVARIEKLLGSSTYSAVEERLLGQKFTDEIPFRVTGFKWSVDKATRFIVASDNAGSQILYDSLNIMRSETVKCKPGTLNMIRSWVMEQGQISRDVWDSWQTSHKRKREEREEIASIKKIESKLGYPDLTWLEGADIFIASYKHYQVQAVKHELLQWLWRLIDLNVPSSECIIKQSGGFDTPEEAKKAANEYIYGKGL